MEEGEEEKGDGDGDGDGDCDGGAKTFLPSYPHHPLHPRSLARSVAPSVGRSISRSLGLLFRSERRTSVSVQYHCGDAYYY